MLRTRCADLHPADEIRAFGKMYAKNLGAAHIAKVFGTTEARVYRRLALAELPTPILDALKAGDISLSMATAVLHQSPDKRGVPLPVKMVSQLTQTWHSQVRSFC